MSEREIDALREENARLRAELDAVVDAEARAAGQRRKALFGGLRLLLMPALDRKRVVRNFVYLFKVGTRYTGPRQTWPRNEEVAEAAEAFAVSLLRFAIRRRLFLFLFSLIAVLVPAVQVYIALQQNRLVNMQNELITIEADDIVSRGVSSESLLTNELNGALLSGRDVEALNRMLNRIFSAQMGEMMGGLDFEASRRLYLQGTAGRAHLLLALGEALRRPQSEQALTPAALWRLVSDPHQGALSAAVDEAARGRLFSTLRTPRAAFDSPKLEAECQRYLLGLSNVLRRAWALAVAADEREAFFRLLRPLMARVSQVEPDGDRPLVPTLVQTFGDFLIDLAVEPTFGQADPALPADVDGALKAGFVKLQRGVGGAPPKVNWVRLRALLSVPR